MATRLYFVANTAADVSPAFDGSWQSTSGAVRRKMATTTDAATETRANVAVTSGAGNETLGFQLISEPLNAGSISGTVSLVSRGRELAAQDNIGAKVRSIRVCSNDGTSFTGTLLALGNGANTTEMATTLAGHTHASATALSSVAANAGDRIVVEIGYGMTTTGTTPLYDMVIGGSGTDHANTEGDTTGTVPWVEFSANLSFQVLVEGVALATLTFGATAAGVRDAAGQAVAAVAFTATASGTVIGGAPQRSRYFNGSAGSDQIVHFAPGGITAGARTVAVLWRPEQTQFGGLVAGRASGSDVWTLHLDTDGKYYHANDFAGFVGYVVGEWQIIAYSKPSGSAAVRWHLYRYDTAVWSHTAGSTAAAESAIDELRVGRAFGRADGEIAVVGVWNSELSDSAIDTAGLETALQSWLDLSPTALLPFNQTSIATPVEDLAGTSDETSQTGTTVVDTDVPPGFDWNLGGGGGVTGTASGAFAFTGTATATRTVSGTATAALVFTSTAGGVPGKQGQALASLAFVGTAAGVPGVQGQALAAIIFTSTASGVSGTPPVTGQALGALTFTGLTSGVRGTDGQALATLAFTAVGTGTVTVSGAATSTLALTATGAGLRAVVGVVGATATFVAAGSGVRSVFGQATATTLFTATASGSTEGTAVTGAAMAALQFLATARGRVSTVRPFTGTTARPDTGVITRPFTGIVVRP